MPIPEALRLRIQNRVTSILAEAPDLEAAAEPILAAIGAGSGWAWGSFWMLDEAERSLRIRWVWSAPEFNEPDFRTESEGVRFVPGRGLPGLTWIQGSPQWMEDLLGDPRFVGKEVARKAGLKSGFAFPVRLQSRVLGVLTFFSREHRKPDGELLEMMASLGSQMGQFIQRKRAEDTLKRSEERYRALVEQSGEGIFLIDLESGVILESNPAFQALLGYSAEEASGLTLFDIIAHDRDTIQANIQKVLDQGQLRIGERKYRRRDGTLADVDVTVNRLTLPGRPLAVAIVHDLSPRRRAEAERDRLVEILEATTDFVGIADPEGHALYGNRAMRELRGPDSIELKRPIAEAHPPWAARKVLEEAVPTAMKEGVWRGETAFLDQQGREIPISQLILAHRDREGSLAFLSTIARDMSTEKARERELREVVKHLEDLRYAVDESTIFAITDRHGVITEVNKHFCEVSGYSREELLGKTHRIINSSHHPEPFFKELWATILAGKVWRGEIRNRKKDGSAYWVDCTIVPWLDAAGRPERYISLRTVITERKQAEEALLRREQQLQALTAAAQEINSDLDIGTVMRRLVESALHLTNAEDGTFGMLIQNRLEFREYCRSGEWNPIEYTFEQGHGVPGHVMETLQPHISNDAGHDPHVIPEIQKAFGFFNLADIPILDRRGALLGVIEIHNTRDQRPFDDSDLALLQGLAAHAAVALENALRIEETQRQAEALRHTQKLESLGLLAGGIAHDFNNMLSAILGNLGLVMVETPPSSPTHQYLLRMDQAVTRAVDLTRQMLAYSGQGTFQVRRMDLNAVLGEIARLLQASIPKKIQLNFRLQADLPELEGDPAQIEQVIMNLVTNASDAIGDREGRITLATAFQEMDEPNLRSLFPGQELTPGPYLTLEVTDDGCGISPDILDRIFDPFFTTKTTGRGLGLSAMLGNLRAHKGWIKIYTEPGRGSTFRVFLPAQLRAVPPIAATVPALPWKGQGTALVVDDDDEVRSANRALLGVLGFEVLEARDGAEAVERFGARPGIDLVLMDLSMPRLDGMEALHAIRALDPKARVVLCSGFDMRAGQRQPGTESPSAFLQKPFRLAELRKTLQLVFEDKGWEQLSQR